MSARGRRRARRRFHARQGRVWARRLRDADEWQGAFPERRHVGPLGRERRPPAEAERAPAEDRSREIVRPRAPRGGASGRCRRTRSGPI